MVSENSTLIMKLVENYLKERSKLPFQNLALCFENLVLMQIVKSYQSFPDTQKCVMSLFFSPSISHLKYN